MRYPQARSRTAIATGEWDGWTSWIVDLATLPNVACKLSGLITEAVWDGWDAGTIRPYAEHVLASLNVVEDQ